MKETLIIAGFGGQGVLSMGKILAYSGVMQDFEVTWMPSYGPEMRGGTANVTVILSDRKISSPIAHEFDTAIILNQQSMEKFEPMVKPGGVLIYDTNGITRHPVRKDIEVYAIDATAECARMGVENASGQRGGHPPRRRDHPQTLIPVTCMKKRRRPAGRLLFSCLFRTRSRF